MKKKKKLNTKREANNDSALRQETREPSPADFLDFMGDDPSVNGYIFDGPSIISIDQPRLENLNKYAYDVITVQVTDHFEEVAATGDEGD